MADTDTCIAELTDALDGQRAAATFACGGEVSNEPRQDVFMLYEDRSGQAHRINFPASSEDLEILASNCDAATFGVLNEGRLDVEYRSAWKLDKTKFLTSFHPAECDIMELVRELLVPTAGNIGVQITIVTELYKLNVLLPSD